MNKKIIFLVLSLLVSSCSSGNENTIEELEEQIEALENKQNLTPEEETELENLKTQAEEIPPPPLNLQTLMTLYFQNIIQLENLIQTTILVSFYPDIAFIQVHMKTFIMKRLLY